MVRGKLTPTQLDLLAGAASGESLTQVAVRIHVSPSHAYNEMQRVKRVLRAKTIPACVMRAHALGLLSHPTGAELAVFPVENG